MAYCTSIKVGIICLTITVDLLVMLAEYLESEPVSLTSKFKRAWTFIFLDEEDQIDQYYNSCGGIPIT